MLVFCCRDNIPVRNKVRGRKAYLSFMASKVPVRRGLADGLYACGKAGTSRRESWPSHEDVSGPGCDLQRRISRNLLPPPRVPPPSSPFSYELMNLRLSRSEHPNTTVLRSMFSIHKSFKEHFFKCAP